MNNSNKRDCYDCNYCGMDMDMDPYCTAPEVLAENPCGSWLGSERVKRLCPSPAHPLFKVRVTDWKDA